MGIQIRIFVLAPNVVQVQAARQPRANAIVHFVLIVLHNVLLGYYAYFYEHTSRLYNIFDIL